MCEGWADCALHLGGSPLLEVVQYHQPCLKDREMIRNNPQPQELSLLFGKCRLSEFTLGGPHFILSQ